MPRPADRGHGPRCRGRHPRWIGDDVRPRRHRLFWRPFALHRRPPRGLTDRASSAPLPRRGAPRRVRVSLGEHRELSARLREPRHRGRRGGGGGSDAALSSRRRRRSSTPPGRVDPRRHLRRPRRRVRRGCNPRLHVSRLAGAPSGGVRVRLRHRHHGERRRRHGRRDAWCLLDRRWTRLDPVSSRRR